jgi:hypothetical protein
MHPILLPAIAIASAIVYIFSDNKIKYNNMANTHSQFLKFSEAVSLTNAKKEKLKTSRQALQRRIVEYFKVRTNVLVPKFYIQGSYKMKTMAIKKDGSYDVDLGVYFLTRPNVEPLTLQKHVAEAVKDHTVSGVQHKDKCIRVIYKDDFDIDLPVYYKAQSDRHPFLATKSQWQESDPKELCDWFEKQRAIKDNDGQILRLIKYFKVWANQQSRKMPSGIAFTVWVATYYKSNLRDDISFYETAKAIKDSFIWRLTCKNPATPGDDLLAKLDYMQKDNFEKAFNQLIKDAEQALQHSDQIKALNIWKQQFGDKFPMA